KMKTWINSLLEGERDEFLGRGRHAPLDEGHDNYRNGYRPRRINFFGLGEVELKVPRDRQGEFTSQWLPERKGQDPELEAFLAEAFLAGLSTRDLARICLESYRCPRCFSEILGKQFALLFANPPTGIGLGMLLATLPLRSGKEALKDGFQSGQSIHDAQLDRFQLQAPFRQIAEQTGPQIGSFAISHLQSQE